MARVSVNMYTAQRLLGRIDGAPQVLLDETEKQLQKVGDNVAQEWSDAIPAGRGGSHNSQMKDITAQVTQPRSGGFFLRMGWLNGGPPPVGGGASTWFVYHDTGYLAFNRGPRVEGLGQFLKRRAQVLDASERIKSRVEVKLQKHLRG